MNISMTTNEIINSDDYIDLVVENTKEIEKLAEEDDYIYSFHVFGEYCIMHIHKDRFESFLNQMSDRIIYNFPIPLGILDEIGLTESGIEYLHSQPYMQLRGAGVLIAVIDTGIDYSHPAFIHPNNTTKILRIWDQTVIGKPPEGYYLGHEYTSEDINVALQNENPNDIVEHSDTIGHGTAIAGIAAGNDEANNFIGAAPDADLIVVKIKPAKQNFKDHWMIMKEEATVFQETDIILAIRYVAKVAIELNRPVVINLSFGTSNSAHDNTGIGAATLVDIGYRRGFCFISAIGNEGISSHHVGRVLSEDNTKTDIELKVGEKEKGFCLETWVDAPDIMSVFVTSPMNEFVSMIPKKTIVNETNTLLMERTEITIESQLSNFINGDQVIRIKLKNPTPGIWTISFNGQVNLNRKINTWLPIKSWIEDDTFFLDPSPYYSGTSPGTSTSFISAGAYDHRDGSLYIHSGRGPSRSEHICPDLVAPGVNIRAPWPNNEYNYISGTSIASAMVAGSAALLLEWGIVRGNDPSMNTIKLRNYLIRGARREETISYPNNIWGYGKLDLFSVFSVMIF